MSFTHLNVSSAFSAHYGVNRPNQLASAAAAMASPALAITDRDGLYGAIKHIGSCIQAGIIPIVGVSLQVTAEKPLGRVVILAHGNNRGKGWATLCRIISQAQEHRGKKKEISISITDLARFFKDEANCTILIGPESALGKLALPSRSEALKSARQWLEYFPLPSSLAIELVNHMTEPGTVGSAQHANSMFELSKQTGIPAIITNAVRYIEPDGALTADVLDSARNLEALGLFAPQPNAQASLKSWHQMAAIALEITENAAESVALLRNTELLAQKCFLDPDTDCGWNQPKTPEQSALGITGNPFEVLWQKSHAGISLRYPSQESYSNPEPFHWHSI